MKKALSNIIKINLDIFFLFFFIIQCFFIFFIKRKKIRESEYIISFKNGGFGHQFLTYDILRYYTKKKITILLFYDRTRHNKILHNIFNSTVIIFPTCYGEKFSYSYRFGEYEGSKYNVIENTLIKLIKVIYNKKVITYADLYRNFEKKYNKKFKFKNKKHHPIYFQIYQKIVLKYKKKLNLLLKFKISKIKKNKKKLVTIYLRKKGGLEGRLRSGSLKSDYYKLFNFLIKNKFQLLLVGDKIFSKHELLKYNYNILDYEISNTNREKFNIIAPLRSNNFISECGGFHFFSFYIQNCLMINCWPLRYHPLSFKKILYKNKRGRIISNSSDQILNFVKKNI